MNFTNKGPNHRRTRSNSTDSPWRCSQPATDTRYRSPGAVGARCEPPRRVLAPCRYTEPLRGHPSDATAPGCVHPCAPRGRSGRSKPPHREQSGRSRRQETVSSVPSEPRKEPDWPVSPGRNAASPRRSAGSERRHSHTTDPCTPVPQRHAHSRLQLRCVLPTRSGLRSMGSPLGHAMDTDAQRRP